MLAFGSYITHTISAPELVWTFFTAVGFWINLSLFKEAGRDLLSLREANINSIREYAAISNLVSEGLRTFVQFIFLLLGLVSLFFPNEHPVPTYQWVITIAFVIMAVLLAGSSYIDKIRRKRLMELILSYEDH